MTRINLRTKATEDCPNCRTTHILTIEHDEDGGYVDIDCDFCNADNCTRKLCSACPQFKCSLCDLKFCEEHGTRINPHETVCPECAEILKKEAYSEGANTGAGSTHTPGTDRPCASQSMQENIAAPESTNA